jgi:hypothetical protein
MRSVRRVWACAEARLGTVDAPIGFGMHLRTTVVLGAPSYVGAAVVRGGRLQAAQHPQLARTPAFAVGERVRSRACRSRIAVVDSEVAVPDASGNNSVVECDLAKVEVAGSNPVSRSTLRRLVCERVRVASQVQAKGARRSSRRDCTRERRWAARVLSSPCGYLPLDRSAP